MKIIEKEFEANIGNIFYHRGYYGKIHIYWAGSLIPSERKYIYDNVKKIFNIIEYDVDTEHILFMIQGKYKGWSEHFDTEIVPLFENLVKLILSKGCHIEAEICELFDREHYNEMCIYALHDDTWVKSSGEVVFKTSDFDPGNTRPLRYVFQNFHKGEVANKISTTISNSWGEYDYEYCSLCGEVVYDDTKECYFCGATLMNG